MADNSSKNFRPRRPSPPIPATAKPPVEPSLDPANVDEYSHPQAGLRYESRRLRLLTPAVNKVQAGKTLARLAHRPSEGESRMPRHRYIHATLRPLSVVLLAWPVMA